MSEKHNIKKQIPVVLIKEYRETRLSGNDFLNFDFSYDLKLEAIEV
jgi:hypothetical protein